jgi:hypothetical protein
MSSDVSDELIIGVQNRNVRHNLVDVDIHGSEYASWATTSSYTIKRYYYHISISYIY